MKSIQTKVKTRSSNQSGQGMTEYLILVFLIAIGSIALVTQLGGNIRTKFKETGEQITSKLTLRAMGQ